MPAVLQQTRVVVVRFLDRAPAVANVGGNCARWRCVCANRCEISGESGAVEGPASDTIVACPECGRAYFVIPFDRSFGPPIEVVELSRFRW